MRGFSKCCYMVHRPSSAVVKGLVGYQFRGLEGQDVYMV